MQLNPIANLPTPVRAGDVANKDYVDIANRNKVVLQDIDNKIATYFMLKDSR